jgi:Zn-finger nucleic acid-binding protein
MDQEEQNMNCPECQAAPREWHRLGCEWEQCPNCGEHWVDCDCLPALHDRLAWTGCCSWLDACIEFGFFEKEVDGKWVACRGDDSESQPDVSRLSRKCRWNQVERKYVLIRKRTR